jgi:hypothetical protein
MASFLGSTGANIAWRSVLHPGGRLLGKSDIFTYRVADMGEGGVYLDLQSTGDGTSILFVFIGFVHAG